MDYDNLDFVNPEEEGVVSSDEEEREEETRPKRGGGRRGPDVEWREIERKIVTNIMMMLIYDLPLAACHDQF